MVAAQRCDGATTVSATMLLAARVGIAVFVTGGKHVVQTSGKTIAGRQARKVDCTQRHAFKAACAHCSVVAALPLVRCLRREVFPKSRSAG